MPRNEALRYSLDCEPGLHRRQGAHGFEYVNARGRVVKAPGYARAHQVARHSARMDRRLDLRRRRRSSAGHGPRCARAQAVSLPPAATGTARRAQVRPHVRLRRGTARHPSARARRPRPAGPAAQRKVLARWCACSKPRVSASATSAMPRRTTPSVSRRCATATCDVAGTRVGVRVSRQERQVPQGRGGRSSPGAHHPPLPRAAGPGIVRVPRRRRPSRRPSAPRT